MTPPIIEKWLRFATTGDATDLDALLDDDVVFYSPAVFAPQEGRVKASAYLLAAEKMFSDANFRYVNQWYADRSAVLEFRAELGGIIIEGVDMIFWNDADRIESFKVMIRPFKALQTIMPKMAELLRL
ncbi:MAG: nuclear transport factor 2 family protein [Mycobacterium sp.]|nr:nuclear transport factor 2 family protein [Mycobacterium sp.]